MIIAPRPGFIGIDIGTSSVKMAQIQKRAGRLEIVDAAIVPRRNPWSFDSWHESDPQSSSAEIQAARSMGFGFSGKAAAATATMALCDTRGMKIDLSSDDLLNRQQIISEMQQLDRFDIDSREFDYWAIKRKYQINGSNVHVMSLDSQWARQFADDQAVARLDCQLLDGMPMALARAVNLANEVPSSEPVAIVDWGYTRATFCVAVGGSPVFVRMLRGSGFQNVVEAVSDSFDVDSNEATKLLTETGLPATLKTDTEVQQVIEDVTLDALSMFCSELTRTLGFVRQNQPNNTPRQLIMTGGGSTVRNVGSWLEKRSKLRIRPWALDPGQLKLGRHESFPVSLFAPAIALSSLAFSNIGAMA